jgi:hypothetical protein
MSIHRYAGLFAVVVSLLLGGCFSTGGGGNNASQWTTNTGSVTATGAMTETFFPATWGTCSMHGNIAQVRWQDATGDVVYTLYYNGSAASLGLNVSVKGVNYYNGITPVGTYASPFAGGLTVGAGGTSPLWLKDVQVTQVIAGSTTATLNGKLNFNC